MYASIKSHENIINPVLTKLINLYETFNKFIKHRYKTRTLDFSVVAFLALGSMCMPESINAQIVERPRPEEWNQLIDGARFMDRFLPMPDGKGRKESGVLPMWLSVS